MANYYIVKKNGKEYRCETAASAYEMYDCLGRFDVSIEYHTVDNNPGGEMTDYSRIAHKATRKRLSNGTYKYTFPFVECDTQPYTA